MKGFLTGLALGVGLVMLQKSSRRLYRPARTAPGAANKVRKKEPLTRATESNPDTSERWQPALRAAIPPNIAAEETSQQHQSEPQPASSAEELLNSATRQQLMSVYGIGPVLADRIINHRPYTAAYDVVEKGIIPESTFVQLRKQLLEQQSA